LDICDLVRRGDDAKVQQEVDNLLPQFMYNLNGPAAVSILVIGEEYYLMAEEAAKAGDPNQASANYQKALNLWNQFEQAIPDHNWPEYAYYSGIVCQKLGQYEQALSHFQRVTLQWPQFDRAWFAQYLIARCYEKLAEQKKVSLDVVKAAYQQVINKYPDCSVAQTAVQKLASM
jgi:tetratricopeptide (TPR) repeat protein